MTAVVLTYFWRPDPGSKFAAPYTADDVRKLQRMVARHCTVPHRFAVITDSDAFTYDDAIDAVAIDRTTHVPNTCFVRLMTFRPEMRTLLGADTVLQIDLDTLIVGNIDHLVSRSEDLVLWRNPARIPWADADLEPYLARHGVTVDPAERARYRCIVVEQDGRPKVYLTNQRRCLYNTSVLFHRCGARPALWAGFDPRNPPAKDDQWYLSDVIGEDCPYFDGARDGVYRLAREDTPNSGVDGTLPENACIVTFAGSDGKADNPRVLARNPWIAGHQC